MASNHYFYKSVFISGFIYVFFGSGTGCGNLCQLGWRLLLFNAVTLRSTLECRS